MVFSSILFWQPTYTNLIVSNNGLLGFLMGRIVTTMVLGHMDAIGHSNGFDCPPFHLVGPFATLLPSGPYYFVSSAGAPQVA